MALKLEWYLNENKYGSHLDLEVVTDLDVSCHASY